MKKKNIILGVLAAGTAAAFTGAGAVFHNIIVRKKQEPTDIIVAPDAVNGAERKQLWTESNCWLNERGSEKVSIQSFDGLILRGEFFEGEGEPDSTVLLVHGYRCNRRREYAAIARFYLEAGYNVLLVDNRAHGESDGRYIGFGILDREDCYRWVRFLDDRFDGKQNIFLHGISMGAATVLMASDLCFVNRSQLFHLTLSAWTEDGAAVLSVEDSGKGFPEEFRGTFDQNHTFEVPDNPESDNHVGLRNIYQRLLMYCGEDASLKIDWNGEWSRVEIKIRDWEKYAL